MAYKRRAGNSGGARVRWEGTMAEHWLSTVHAIPYSSCWYSELTPNGQGYIMVASAKNGRELAHRVAYKHFVGPIPDGLVVDHKCRNRECSNPDHLQLVTLEENTRLGSTRRPPNEECRRGHPYVFGSYSWAKDTRGRRYRACRVCNRERARRRNG